MGGGFFSFSHFCPKVGIQTYFTSGNKCVIMNVQHPAFTVCIDVFQKEHAALNRENAAAEARERITDCYLITVFFVFPLFFGFSGYENITFSKHCLWACATVAWLVCLAACTLRRRDLLPLPRPRAPQLAALALLAVCLLSWLFSPWRRESLLGAGRYDGLVTDALYILMFLGISRFARPKRFHMAALAAGIGLCCVVAALQLFGLNPLGLFPRGVGYYDRGILYSGAYLGTVGNTNILDALLCTALPLFFALYVRGGSPLFLLPLLPGCFTLGCAGGSGAAVALLAAGAAALPLLCTTLSALRRALRGFAAALVPLGLALAWAPETAFGLVSPRLDFSLPALAALGTAALLTALSILPAGRRPPSPRALRRGFLLLDAAALLGALAFLWLYPGTEGTLRELHQALHGHLDDSFGSSRIRIWRECLALVPERPLLGGGPGTLALRLDILFTRFVPETGQTLTASVDNAHNIYLARLVNCGALGLCAALSLPVCVVRAAVPLRTPMAAALLLSVLCAAVHGLFGLGLSLSEPVFWAVLGLLCASARDNMEASL